MKDSISAVSIQKEDIPVLLDILTAKADKLQVEADQMEKDGADLNALESNDIRDIPDHLVDKYVRLEVTNSLINAKLHALNTFNSDNIYVQKK